ncbi:MAG: dephospho-CoA kinase [Legionella sp.]|jgi:dephospho-CoA kinase
MIYCVGLTGNLASGKSTAAKLFAELGVDVINADLIAKELTAEQSPVLSLIEQHFGPNILLNDGKLNRKLLREIIFNDAQERLWLEQLLHPLIRERIQEHIQNCHSAYCVIEIPLLLDRSHYPYLNRVLLIHAPIEQQIQRVQERDHCSKEQALAILATQPDLELRLGLADDVVENDGGLEELRQKIGNLHTHYLNLKPPSPPQ